MSDLETTQQDKYPRIIAEPLYYFTMLKKLTKGFQDSFKQYWITYRTDQILRLYNKEKYDKIPKQLGTFKAYQYVKVRDYGLLFFLISEENKVAIEKLLTKVSYKEKILNDTENPSQLSASTFAVLNNMPEMSLYLQQFGANIFAPNEEGNTLLHLAAFHKNLEAVKFALNNNLSLDALNLQGSSPLFYAIMKESHEIIEYLLQKGANCEIQNKEGFFPIHEAVYTGNLDTIKLLEHSLLKIRSLKPKIDPIHIASQLESTDPLLFFLEKDPKYVNLADLENKQTPLHYSVNANSIECTRLLLQKGSNPNIQDNFGNTPMHFTTLSKSIEMCYLLEEFGADARIKNKDGLSSIDICITDKDQTMINYFKGLNKYSSVFLNLYV